jgi:hypothetical protein
MPGSSSSSLSLGNRQEFCHLIREADEGHWWFFVGAHEVRWLELDLDAVKVALAALEGETTTAQVAPTDA